MTNFVYTEIGEAALIAVVGAIAITAMVDGLWLELGLARLDVVAVTSGYGWVAPAPGLVLAGLVALGGLHLARRWGSELLAVAGRTAAERAMLFELLTKVAAHRRV